MPTLNPEKWERLEALMDEALERPPEERDAFLSEACADDPDLRLQVQTMLQAGDSATSFLEDDAHALGALLNDLHAPKTSTDEDLGERQIGPYRLLRRIGRGGMGQVYLALRDGAYTQNVAVKVIRRGLDTDDILQRFRTERQILASLSHPNIARLLDGGSTDDGLSYFVMEYVEGCPITDYCDRHRLSLDERLQLFQDVCSAVHYAHQNLVVHRDLKPSNILVTEDRQVKLLDFGIAKLLDGNGVAFTMPHTRTEVRVMTPEYASPEQIRGLTVTTASDVFSLGVLLYELLAGQRPFQLQERGPAELERLICDTDPTPPSTAIIHTRDLAQADGTLSVSSETISQARAAPLERLRRSLSGDLDTIVLMALRKEPERRYQSADQLSEDIRRHLEGLPVIAQRPTLGYRTWKFVRRNRMGVAAAASFVVFLFLIAGLALRFAVVTAAQAERIELEAAKVSEVKDFLVSLFEVSDPEISRGDEITAFELLERGSSQIEGDLADQPAVQAELLNVMGVVYRQLGIYDKARTMLERALTMRRALYAEPNLELAQSLYDLSWLLDEMGEYDAAMLHGREALAIRQTLLGPDHPKVAQSLNDLGIILVSLGDFSVAEDYFRAGLTLRRKHFSAEHKDVIESLMNLAWVVHERGAYDEAEQLYRESLSLLKEHHPEERSHTSIVLTNLGALLYDRGTYEEAESYFSESLSVRRELLDPNHPLVANLYNWLGRVKHQQGAYQEAEDLYRHALSRHRETLGDEHRLTARDVYFLALLMYDRGQNDEARALFEEAAVFFAASIPADHPLIAENNTGLADVLMRLQEVDRAQALYRDALAIYQEKYGDDDQRTARSRLSLAECLTAQGRFDEANGLLKKSLDFFTRHRDDEQVTEVNRALDDLRRARAAHAGGTTAGT